MSRADTTAPTRYVCGSCYAHVTEPLTAPHPFQDGLIYGCPKCCEAETLRATCDVPGCWELGDCGTPVQHGVSEGYRWTCHWHKP